MWAGQGRGLPVATAAGALSLALGAPRAEFPLPCFHLALPLDRQGFPFGLLLGALAVMRLVEGVSLDVIGVTARVRLLAI